MCTLCLEKSVAKNATLKWILVVNYIVILMKKYKILAQASPTLKCICKIPGLGPWPCFDHERPLVNEHDGILDSQKKVCLSPPQMRRHSLSGENTKFKKSCSKG